MRAVTLKRFYGADIISLLGNPPSHSNAGYASQRIILNNEWVEGFLQYSCLKGITICYQEWNLKKPFSLLISSDKSLLKIQFQIEGNSLFLSNNNNSINIPNCHYQFLCFPIAKAEIQFTSSRKVLDIFINEIHLMKFLDSQGICNEAIKFQNILRKYAFFCSQIKPAQNRLIDELLYHSYSLDFAKDFARVKALELIFSVFKESEPIKKVEKWRTEDKKILCNIKNYLDSNFHKELHLKSISRLYGINEFKLKKGFKDLFDDTVISYVRKKRLDYAHDLLMNSKMDIKEIAFICGFKYPHHFTQVYLRYYRELPSHTRRELLP